MHSIHRAGAVTFTHHVKMETGKGGSAFHPQPLFSGNLHSSNRFGPGTGSLIAGYMHMQIHAIVNGKAGTLIDQDPVEFATIIEKGLSIGEHEVQVELLQPEDIPAAMERAVMRNIDVLAVGGGDGTINAAAGTLADSDIALGIIPLGTINLLARDLEIPFEPEKAAAVIATGEKRSVDVACVNGSLFLCSSLLGIPIQMAERRQSLRGKNFPERVGGYYSMARDFLSNRRRFSVEVDDGHVARKVLAMSIAVSNNPLAPTAGAIPKRESIDSGKLALYLSKHKSGAAMGWAIAQRMAGIWQRDPEIEELLADEIILRSNRRRVRLSNDGEIVEMNTPLHYTVKPRALNVMMPRSAAS
jgi:diacylglycerol kinase family enzyme